MTLPFRMLHRNIMLGAGDNSAAVFRVDTISYPFMSEADKLAWLARLARFAYSINTDFSLYRVCRAYPAAQYIDQAASMLDERHANAEDWEQYLQGHQTHLAGLASFIPEIYLTVSLGNKGAVKSTPTGWAERFTRAREKAKAVRGRDLDALQAGEDRVFRIAANTLPLRRATTREIQWLLRRPASRGLAEPKIDENWKPVALTVTTDSGEVVYEPRKSDLVRHLNAPLVEQDRGVMVRSEEGDSYQAMLAVGALPDVSEFPGTAELIYQPLESVPFPVDAVLHVRRIPNKEAAKTARNKVIDADNVYDDASSGSHGTLSYLPAENRQIARDLDAYLQSSDRPPLLDVAISLAVGAPEPGLVDERVDLLEQHYGTVALHRPLGLQAALFHDHLPRPDRGKVRDYAAMLTIEQFGGLMPVGVHQTGSDTGAFIGRVVTGGNRPVKLDVTEASRRKRTPSILLAGTLGSGKTTAGQLIALQAALRGSRVVTVDPKPDHNLESLPELDGRVDVLELSGEERYRGLLDPLAIAPPALREDLAASYLIDLIPQAPPGWETQVRKAIKAALLEGETGSMGILARLEASDNPDARHAGEALSVWADSGLGRLAFGDGSRGTDAHATHTVTTIRPGGLMLPEPGVARSDYDPAERISVATLKLVASYAMKLVSGDNTVHKLLLFDEAWFLLASRDGRRLIDRINHYGRSQNATLVLSTQRLGPVGDIEELIGTRLIFGEETDAQAKHALALLGLDPEDRGLVSRVRSYRRGRCLMRDLDGRVAECQIDVVYPHILDVLDTSPRDRHAVYA